MCLQPCSAAWKKAFKMSFLISPLAVGFLSVCIRHDHTWPRLVARRPLSTFAASDRGARGKGEVYARQDGGAVYLSTPPTYFEFRRPERVLCLPPPTLSRTTLGRTTLSGFWRRSGWTGKPTAHSFACPCPAVLHHHLRAPHPRRRACTLSFGRLTHRHNPHHAPALALPCLATACMRQTRAAAVHASQPLTAVTRVAE